jgi:hypothetical protein
MIIYCTCSSTKKAVLERREGPGGLKWVVPSLLCPDCKQHRPLSGFRPTIDMPKQNDLESCVGY